MAQFTLDDIRAAADAKYGSLDIPIDETRTVRLRNPLRLSKTERDALMDIQDRMGEDDREDGLEQEEALDAMIRLVADNKKLADVLLSQLGDDLAAKAIIFEKYGDGTKVGEASASHD